MQLLLKRESRVLSKDNMSNLLESLSGKIETGEQWDDECQGSIALNFERQNCPPEAGSIPVVEFYCEPRQPRLLPTERESEDREWQWC